MNIPTSVYKIHYVKAQHVKWCKVCPWSIKCLPILRAYYWYQDDLSTSYVSATIPSSQSSYIRRDPHPVLMKIEAPSRVTGQHNEASLHRNHYITCVLTIHPHKTVWSRKWGKSCFLSETHKQSVRWLATHHFVADFDQWWKMRGKVK